MITVVFSYGQYSPVCSHVVDTLTDIFRCILSECDSRRVAGEGERGWPPSTGQKSVINRDVRSLFLAIE